MFQNKHYISGGVSERLLLCCSLRCGASDVYAFIYAARTCAYRLRYILCVYMTAIDVDVDSSGQPSRPALIVPN